MSIFARLQIAERTRQATGLSSASLVRSLKLPRNSATGASLSASLKAAHRQTSAHRRRLKAGTSLLLAEALLAAKNSTERYDFMTIANPKIDLSGQRFGRLIVKEFAGNRKFGSNGHSAACWHCRCDCGITITAIANNLKKKNTKSCGCLQREKTAARNKTHGKAVRGKKHALYSTWMNIKSRCNDPNDPAYSTYGGRGITVCARWLDGDDAKTAFECFLDDVGERPPGTSIDRTDNNKGYQPDNIRWASQIDQARNRRSNRPVIRGDGARFSTMKEAAEVSGCRWWDIKKCLEGRANFAASFTWKEEL